MTGRDDSFVEATTSRPDPEEAMRSLSLLLAPLMLSLAALACSDGEVEGLADLEADLIPTGSAAPDVTLIAMDDSEFKLSSLRGKTLLLNFWFHGCAACREEMPQLQGLWSEVSSQRSDVAFLAINRGDDKEEIDYWWTNSEFTLQAVRQDDEDVSEAFGVKAYPTNYVVGPDGRVIYRGVGYDQEAQAKIRLALDSTAPAR